MLEYAIVHIFERKCVHVLVRVCSYAGAHMCTCLCVCVHVCGVYFQKPYFSYSSVFSRATPAWHVDPYFCNIAMCPSLSLCDQKSRKKKFRLYLLTPDSAWGVVLFYVRTHTCDEPSLLTSKEALLTQIVGLFLYGVGLFS